VARVVTSIRVNNELWKEAKIHAIRKGITLTQLIERLLIDELKRSGVLFKEMKA